MSLARAFTSNINHNSREDVNRGAVAACDTDLPPVATPVVTFKGESVVHQCFEGVCACVRLFARVCACVFEGVGGTRLWYAYGLAVGWCIYLIDEHVGEYACTPGVL